MRKVVNVGWCLVHLDFILGDGTFDVGVEKGNKMPAPPSSRLSHVLEARLLVPVAGGPPVSVPAIECAATSER